MSAARPAPADSHGLTDLHSQTQSRPGSAPQASPTISTASRSVPLKAPSMWARLKLLVMRLMPMPSVMVSCGFLRRLPSASSLVYMTPRVTCTRERGEIDALPQPCQWQLPSASAASRSACTQLQHTLRSMPPLLPRSPQGLLCMCHRAAKLSGPQSICLTVTTISSLCYTDWSLGGQ